jgi:phosphoglycerol transferase
LTVLVLALQLVPTLVYRLHHGPNHQAVSRSHIDAEIYGLRITQLLLPVSCHRLSFLAKLKAKYYDSPLVPFTEADAATLGAVGAVGFLFLLGALFLRKRTPQDPRPLDGMAMFNAAGLMLAGIGGLGSLASLLGLTWIRAYNRISIFLAFFALFAAGWLVHCVEEHWRGRLLSRWAFFGLLAAILVLGIADQTSEIFVPPYAELQRSFAEDEKFVQSLEERLPPGAMIFQTPYVSYVEHAPPPGMESFEQLKPYLHAHSLRWSYGAIEGRFSARWQKLVVCLPTPRQRLDALALSGFAGVLVSRRAYPDQGRRLDQEMEPLLGPAQCSPDGKWAFYDLTGYAQKLRGKYTPEEWERLRQANLRSPGAGLEEADAPVAQSGQRP